MGGDLVLKVEYRDAVVQVLVRGAGRFPEDGGIEIRHRFGLRMPHSVPRMLEFWAVAGRPAPRNGGGLGGEDGELVQVLDGLRKNKTPRRIAEDIWGKARVAAEWNSDSWMRSQVRRWIPKARALADGGWRDLVPRYVPEE